MKRCGVTRNHRRHRHGACAWLLALACCGSLAVAAERPPAAAVATSHPLATRAGVEVLKQGGNAFDAAAAITAVLAVVEPYSSGFGGGGMWLIHRSGDGRQVLIDGRERAPEMAHWRQYHDAERLSRAGTPRKAALSAAIPGIPAGIAHLARHYGRLPLTATLRPARRYADKGFYVNAAYQSAARQRVAVLSSYPDTAAIFLRQGRIPRQETLLRQKDLARTLAALAEQGHDGFYQGEVADRLVLGVGKHGGIWTKSDLLRYQIREREPLTFTYREMRVITAPPPSTGGVALAQAMGMLGYYDLTAMDNTARAHHVVEALRRVMRDGAVYLGDPDLTVDPIPRLLNAEYLEGLALSIEPARATPSAVLGDTPGWEQTAAQTTHFSIIDGDGNRVAGTLSGSAVFGSGFVPAGTGVLLNNAMDDFSAPAETTGHPNAMRPGQRPSTSMTPAFLETPERVAVLGTPGGGRIISMMLLAALDFSRGLSLGGWILQPRYHHPYLPDVLEFEPGAWTDEEQQSLRAMGHTLQPQDGKFGNVQAVTWDRENNRVYAASDPRGLGVAQVIIDEAPH